MAHYKLPMLEGPDTRSSDMYGDPIDPQEWLSLEYVDWKSGGDTRFAPLASAYGEIECNGFWHFDPPKPDKDGVWIDSQVEKAPTLVKRAGIRSQRRPLPRHRTAAELPPTPCTTPTRTTTTASTPTAGLGRALLHEPHRRQDTYMVLRRTSTTRAPRSGSTFRPAPSSWWTPSDCGTPCGTTATSRATA